MRLSLRLLAIACALTAGLAQGQVPADPYNYSRSSSFTYDPNSGLLLSEVVEPGSQSCVNTSYLYDSYGNKRAATTSNCSTGGFAAFAPRSSESTYAASTVTLPNIGTWTVPAGTFATSSSNALGHVENKQFDPRFGVVMNLTGPNGLTTTVTVDDFGRPVRETRADKTSTMTAYCYLLKEKLTDLSSNSPDCPALQPGEQLDDAASFVHTEPRDANGNKNGPFSRVYLDRAGRKLRSVTEAFDGPAQPGGVGRFIAQDTNYSPQGLPIIVTQPYFLDSNSSNSDGNGIYGISYTEYDVLGRVTHIYTSDPLGLHGGFPVGPHIRVEKMTLTKMLYDGLWTSTLNDRGESRTVLKNIDGQVVRVTDGLGATVVHQYDAFGNLIVTKDALQNNITIAYDIRGRKMSMNDPDTGIWLYEYNALGELVWQQSPNQRALSQATALGYDLLGRMTSRVEPEYASYWRYDSYFDGSACNKGIGKLCATSTTNGISRKIAYDNFGRALNTRTDITGGPSFTSGVRYDANGRLVSQIYPTGVEVDYQYTAKGFLASASLMQAATITPLPGAGGAAAPATSRGPNSLLWQGQSYNAWGRAEQQFYGNNVTVRADFDPTSGRIRRNTAAPGNSYNSILDYTYIWDSLNRLVHRDDENGDGTTGAVTDDFGYDPIGRLTSYSVSAASIPGQQRIVTLQYNALGSLLYKSDVGNYSYPAQGSGSLRPHALQNVSGAVPASYTYDANGNLTGASAGSYRKVSYTSFNLPDAQNGLEGPNGTPRYTWQYDENHQRVKETRSDFSGTRVTWMMHPDNAGGLAFESEQSGNTISNRHYLSIGGSTLGVLVTTGSLPPLGAGQMEAWILPSITLVKQEYWHTDMQGSLIATTDHNGTVTARYSYDPFGKRRSAGGSYDASGKLVYDWNKTSGGTDRGYTGHEHLDDVGVIHMNGRIFDPRLGIFMQGDPFIQDPANLQNYNRYTYCYNNPMTCSDPSGYLFGGMFSVPFIDNAWNNHIKPYAPMIASIVVAVYMPQMLASMQFGSFSQAAITGFASGAVSTGNLKGGIQGAFTASLFYGVGANIQNYTDKAGNITNYAKFSGAVAAHGVVGCISSSMAGGKCGAGAISAALSKAMFPVTGPMTKNNIVVGTIISAAVGGTASVLGGGKFANGAQTAAFGYMFNGVLSRALASLLSIPPARAPDPFNPDSESFIIPGGGGTLKWVRGIGGYLQGHADVVRIADGKCNDD